MDTFQCVAFRYSFHHKHKIYKLMQQKQLIHLEKDYSKDIIKENDYIQKLEIGITIEQLKKKI